MLHSRHLLPQSSPKPRSYKQRTAKQHRSLQQEPHKATEQQSPGSSSQARAASSSPLPRPALFCCPNLLLGSQASLSKPRSCLRTAPFSRFPSTDRRAGHKGHQARDPPAEASWELNDLRASLSFGDRCWRRLQTYAHSFLSSQPTVRRQLEAQSPGWIAQSRIQIYGCSHKG